MDVVIRSNKVCNNPMHNSYTSDAFIELPGKHEKCCQKISLKESSVFIFVLLPYYFVIIDVSNTSM